MKIMFGNHTITYTITRSNRRKTSAIIVDSSGVEVKTPVGKKNSEIRQMILNRKDWIFKKQLEFEDKKKLRINYKPKTIEYLKKRTQNLAVLVGVKPSRIYVKQMKTRWGSSTKSGTITLNKAIVKTPSRIIDYVILHELCHLKIPDHSKRFWSLLYEYDKNFEENKRWLDLHDLSIIN